MSIVNFFIALLAAIALLPGMVFLAGISFSRRITPEPFPATALGRLSLACGVTLAIHLLLAPIFFPSLGTLTRDFLIYEKRVITRMFLEEGVSYDNVIHGRKETVESSAANPTSPSSAVQPEESSFRTEAAPIQSNEHPNRLETSPISMPSLYRWVVGYFLTSITLAFCAGSVFSAIIFPGPHPFLGGIRRRILGDWRDEHKQAIADQPQRKSPRRWIDLAVTALLRRSRNAFEHQYVYTLGKQEGRTVSAFVLVESPSEPTHPVYHGVVRTYGVEKDGSGRLSYIILSSAVRYAFKGIEKLDPVEENGADEEKGLNPSSGTSWKRRRDRANQAVYGATPLMTRKQHLEDWLTHGKSGAAKRDSRGSREGIYISGTNILAIYIVEKKDSFSHKDKDYVRQHLGELGKFFRNARDEASRDGKAEEQTSA